MALPTASDNPFPSLLLTEGSAPSSPAAGKQRLFIDSADHLLKYKNSSGTVTAVSAGGSGSITASGYTQSTARLLGRTTASTGAIEEITVGSGLSLSAGSLTATGGSAGALVFLEAHTASASSSLDFTSFISSTYDTYKIIGTELVLATNGANLLMEMGTGGGPTWDTGNNYEWSGGTLTTGGTGSRTPDFASTGICRVFVSAANAAAYGFGSFDLTAYALQSTSLRKTVMGSVYYVHTTGPAAVLGPWGMQWVTSGTAVTGLRFIASSGNITSGTIRIYGVAKS